MATQQNKTSRRSVLGAIAAIPAAAIAAPAFAELPADRSAWDQAFAEFQRASAILERDGCDEFGEAWCEAASRLMQTPAPDGEALLWKLEHLFGLPERDPDDYGASWCPEYVNGFMADARRMLAA